MVKVKICGVTNYDDALLVTNLGAEYIGFNMYKESDRKVSDKLAKDVISKLPPFVAPVALFVDEEIKTVIRLTKKCGFKLVQLHGSETPDQCRQVAAETGAQVIKAFRLSDETSLQQIPPYVDAVQYFLLDTLVPDVAGGTGQTFNWDLAVKVKELGKPFFLAGGLTPDNVAEAIEKVQPFAVDVASGVERLPRRKDYDKMNLFIRRARGLK